MLWWGRVGKLAQFTGGLVAILDIIGPDRIQAWGLRLRDRSRPGRRFASVVRRSGEIYGEVFGDLVDSFTQAAHSRPGSPNRGRSVPRRTLSDEAIRVRWVVRVAYVLLVAAGWVWMFWYEPVHDAAAAPTAWWWVPVLAAGVAVGLMILPWLLIIVFTAAALVADVFARFWSVALYYLIVWPPLVILRGPQPDRSLRVAGILFVVAGFSFDLLAT
jgi:hypothetical protein